MNLLGWLDNGWRDLTGADPVAWLAVAIWVTLGVVVVALLVANHQLRQTRRLRAERSRPQVAMFMEPHATDWQLIELVVRNFGATAAYDIRWSFPNPPTVAAYENAHDGYADVIVLTLPDRLPSLAPGQEWRLVWDSARDRAQIGNQIESRFTGTLTYYDRPADPAPRWWRQGPLRETRRRPLHTDVSLDWEALPPTQRIELMTTHDLARREKQKLELLRAMLTYFQYAAKETRPEVLRSEIDRMDRAARDVQDRWRTRQIQHTADPDTTVRLDVGEASDPTESTVGASHDQSRQLPPQSDSRQVHRGDHPR